jgi:cardiolipin synthase
MSKVQAAFGAYRTGRDLYPALKEEIRRAKKEILLNFYTFCADETGREFARLLSEKAKSGVTVKVLFDAFGSRHQEEQVMEMLCPYGVQARVFRPFYRMLLRHPLIFMCRNHARIFLFDRKIFFTGGVGIGNIYVNREDFSVGLNVSHAEHVTSYFNYLWELAERKWASFPLKEPPREVAPGVSMLVSGPLEPEQEIYRWLQKRCEEATRRIVIVNPFFFPQRRLLKTLIVALERGVAVDVITPLQTDKPYYDQFRALPAPILTKRGARWWGTRTYFHEKLFVADDYWSLGSANFDVISTQRNFELNLAGRAGNMLKTIERAIDDMKRTTRSVADFPAPFLMRRTARVFYSTLEFFFSLT